MVELEQLNIHSSRDIIARHGLTLPELFELSLEFYKEEKHQFNLSYDQKNQLAAYWRQSILGPFHSDKLNPGYFDFVGNDRKKAWEALGEISANGAMAGFCNLLETVCPDLVPWIRHKKRERENKVKNERLKEETRKRKEAEEDMEASKLINIVKKADQLKLQSDDHVDDDVSEDEEMPILEKNDRKIIYAAQLATCEPAASGVEQPLQNGVHHDHCLTLSEGEPTNCLTLSKGEPTNCLSEAEPTNCLSEVEPTNCLSEGEPTNCPELLLPEQLNRADELELVSNENTDSVAQSSGNAVVEPAHTVQNEAPQTVNLTKTEQSTANESTNDSDEVLADSSVTHHTSSTTESTSSGPDSDSLNTVLTQHFACILYLTQMRDNGHTLSSEQESYLSQMSVYEEQLKLLKTNTVQAKGTQQIRSGTVDEAVAEETTGSDVTQQESDSQESNVENTSPAPLESIPNSQESFFVVNSVESLEVIQSEPEEETKQVETIPEEETKQVETIPEVELSSQDVADGVDLEKELTDIQQSPEHADLGAPANATELSALAETLQKQLPDTPTENHVVSGEGSECESESDVRMWSKSGVDLFIAEVSQDTDSVLHVGRGETVTVRIPTYESGTALYWEFATQSFDIGFGASFEWEEEVPTAENPLSMTSLRDPRDVTLRARREPILPILRRSSHEKVITGSHAFPRGGTYLLLFDNSYSLLRSKTVYYRVFYTR